MPLFKYMSVEAAALFARTQRVRFTQPFELNDPFEFRPMLDFEGTADDFRDIIDAKINERFGTVDGVLAMIEEQMSTDPTFPKFPIQIFRTVLEGNPAMRQQLMEEMKRHKAELIESIRIAGLLEGQWEKFRQAAGEAVGIFSLTEDPANTLMWSHYGSQHRGVAVEFDEAHPWFHQRVTTNDDLRHLVQVCYVENTPPRRWTQVNGVDMLYTKNAAWAYEREWRIIRPLKDGTQARPGIFCFDVPHDVVRSIIFGCRATPELERDIRALVAANPRFSHMRFKRAKLAGGKIEIVDCEVRL